MGQPPPITSEQLLLMQMALDAFLTETWPRLKWLQWTLDNRDEDIDVTEQIDALPHSLGGVRLESENGNSVEVLGLTVTGCAMCRGSQALLDTFLSLLKLCIERYLASEKAYLRSQDLAEFPNPSLVRRAYRLLRDEYLFLGGGGGTDDSWQYEVSSTVRYFRNVRTLEEYVDRRRWYLAEPRPRRVRAGRPFPGTIVPPGEDESERPAELFAFVKSERLRKLAQRDHAELTQVTTTKARAVLAGAVVESMLLDRLSDGNPDDELLGLPLGKLYAVARARHVVSDRIAQVVPAVRDFRNLGHPGAELRDGPLTEHEADIAMALMQILIHEFRGAQ